MRNCLIDFLVAFVLIILSQNVYAQYLMDENYILGDWVYKTKPRLFSLGRFNDSNLEVFSNDVLGFSKKYLEVSSGIFNLRERTVKGKYPWMYYGNITSYRLKNDSLQIFDPGSDTWKRFALQAVSRDSLVLKSVTDTWSLMRLKKRKADSRKKNSITAVEIDVFDPEAFLAGYTVRIDGNGISISGNKPKTDAAARKYCRYVLDKFRKLDVSGFAEMYNSEFSANRILDICFEYNYKKSEKSIKIIGEQYPDELKAALITAIYAADFIDYGETWPFMQLFP